MTVANGTTEHDVELTLASTGHALDVWDEYVITHDMLSPGAAFTFAMWRSETRRAAWDVLRREAKCMDSVVLKIDGATQLNGRIERIETGADGHGEARMVLSGRDLAGPALDWDADPTTNVVGLTLERALERVFAGVGLPVRVTTADAAREVVTRRRSGSGSTATEAAGSSARRAPLSPGVARALREASALPSLTAAPVTGTDLSPLTPRGAAARARARRIKDIIIPAGHPRPGERVWAFAESIVARVGALMWVAPDEAHGLTIVVDAPANDDPSVYALARLIRGSTSDPRSNVLSLTEAISTRETPTTVTVYTGGDRGDTISVRQRAEVMNGSLSSAAIARGFVVAEPPSQPRHMRSTRARTVARAAQEASRTIADANRSFRSVTLTVRGHGQLVGGVPTLFAANTVARVYDSVCTDADGAPLDEDMLITRVTFKRTRTAGTTTELTLMPRGAVRVSPDV